MWSRPWPWGTSGDRQMIQGTLSCHHCCLKCCGVFLLWCTPKKNWNCNGKNCSYTVGPYANILHAPGKSTLSTGSHHGQEQLHRNDCVKATSEGLPGSFDFLRRIPSSWAETSEKMALHMSCPGQHLRQVVARTFLILFFMGMSISMAHGKDLIDMEFCGDDDCYKVHVTKSSKCMGRWYAGRCLTSFHEASFHNL
jgi:hypothetical protein